MSDMIRILVADDHAIVRMGIRQFIDDQPDMRVCGEASTGNEVIKLVRSEVFDVVLLDISMPEKNGIDCLKIIRQLNPTLPVLIVSGFPEDRYAMHMFRGGANGYISKNAAPSELIKAIRTVARGHRYLTPQMTDRMTAELATPNAKEPHETLSEREFQIFHKLAAGESASNIARDLNLSTKTVSTYRTRVLGKLKLSTNADLTHYSMKKGLVD